MSKNTKLKRLSKNIVTKHVAINSIEVWMAMPKDNFLRKWSWRLQYSAMLVKQISCEQTWDVS